MSENLFILCQDDLGNYEIRYDDKVFHFLWEVAPILNEQESTISRLEEENDDLRFALRTEQAFARVEKDKKPFLSKEEFLKELEEDE